MTESSRHCTTDCLSTRKRDSPKSDERGDHETGSENVPNRRTRASGSIVVGPNGRLRDDDRVARRQSGPSVKATTRSSSALADRPRATRHPASDFGLRATNATDAARTIAESARSRRCANGDCTKQRTAQRHVLVASDATRRSTESTKACQPARARLFATEPCWVQHNDLVRKDVRATNARNELALPPYRPQTLSLREAADWKASIGCGCNKQHTAAEQLLSH